MNKKLTATWQIEATNWKNMLVTERIAHQLRFRNMFFLSPPASRRVGSSWTVRVASSGSEPRHPSILLGLWWFSPFSLSARVCVENIHTLRCVFIALISLKSKDKKSWLCLGPVGLIHARLACAVKPQQRLRFVKSWMQQSMVQDFKQFCTTAICGGAAAVACWGSN